MTRTYIRKKFLSTAILFVGAGVFLFGASASVQGGIIPECAWAAGETYGLGAFTLLALNVLKFIWSILGSLALVMFVWGGFLWLTARGEENQIKQGWDTLINAVIGLLIVLGSWLIINTIILSLTDPGNWTHVAQVFSEDWTKRVEGDVCIKVAARVASTGIGATLSNSSARGGMVVGVTGGCCGNQGFKQEGGAAFNKMAIEHCAQFVASMSKHDTLRGSNNETSAYFCPSIAPAATRDICGEEFGGSGPDKRRWKGVPDCNDVKIINYATEGRICDDDLTKKFVTVCQEPLLCGASLGLGAGRRCVKEDEVVNCCITGEAELKSNPSKKETYFESGGPTTRKGCRSYSKTITSGDISLGGQVYTNAKFKAHIMCNKDTECGGSGELFGVKWTVAGCQILE